MPMCCLPLLHVVGESCKHNRNYPRTDFDIITSPPAKSLNNIQLYIDRYDDPFQGQSVTPLLFIHQDITARTLMYLVQLTSRLDLTWQPNLVWPPNLVWNTNLPSYSHLNSVSTFRHCSGLSILSRFIHILSQTWPCLTDKLSNSERSSHNIAFNIHLPDLSKQVQGILQRGYKCRTMLVTLHHTACTEPNLP